MQEFGIHQCLPVAEGEPDWSIGEPQTVEEYLKRVRYEARKLPDVVTSTIDPQQFDPQQAAASPAAARRADEVAACPLDRKPSIPWVRQFLQQFSSLQQQLQREQELLAGRPGVPALGAGSPSSLDSAAAARQGLHGLSLEDSPSSLMPELEQLRGLDQVRVLRRLEEEMQRVLQSGNLSAGDCALLYALAARVERPLHGGTCALFRSLLRHCARLRAALLHARDPLLPHLNVLIAIAGGYFGQDEELATLWEED